MTSDAKIGLLLGLVFIFVIAFVINGLPSLRPPVSKNQVPMVVGADEHFTEGITGKTPQGVTPWEAFIDQARPDSHPAPAVVAMPRPAAPQEVPPMPASLAPPPVQPQTASHEGVRSSFSLENLLPSGPAIVQREPVSTINLDTPRPAPELPAAGGRAPVVIGPQPRSEPVLSPRPATAPTTVESREAARPALTSPPSIPGATTYVVVEGDNLGAIAKKVYGPEEGNRVVNIDRIFQANQMTMPSPNSVAVGQKLIIPPLPKPTAAAPPRPAPVPNPNRPADVLPQDHFERVRTPSESMTIAEKLAPLRRVPAAAPAPAPTAEVRWYTVQDGDSLWKIASSQLGSGSRWDEIQKLNTDILSSQDVLKVMPGTRLRLPLK